MTACPAGARLDSVGSEAIGDNPLAFYQGGQESVWAVTHFDIVAPSAGGGNGDAGAAGDHLFRDVGPLGTASGLWGLVRVKDQPDNDGDGIVDAFDNCVNAANGPSSPNPQRDTNGDGFGNVCDADLNNDNVVNFSDLAQMKAVFFTADPDADLNGDGVVNFADLALMKAQFFGAPGPSCCGP